MKTEFKVGQKVIIQGFRGNPDRMGEIRQTDNIQFAGGNSQWCVVDTGTPIPVRERQLPVREERHRVVNVPAFCLRPLTPDTALQ